MLQVRLTPFADVRAAVSMTGLMHPRCAPRLQPEVPYLLVSSGGFVDGGSGALHDRKASGIGCDGAGDLFSQYHCSHFLLPAQWGRSSSYPGPYSTSASP